MRSLVISERRSDFLQATDADLGDRGRRAVPFLAAKSDGPSPGEN